MIAHVDMDAFFASVEVLDQPRLAGRPVIVGGGRRGVVSAASYEARRFGVHSAMPIFQAKRLCPRGVFLTPRMARYQQASRQVMRVLESFSPRVEQVSVDEAYLDLGGTDRLWGPPGQAGQAIKTAMRERTGLTCSVGIAPVRFLAKIASDRDKPDGLTVVTDLEGFLASVTLAQVPGVGKKAQERLKAMGLSHLTQVRALGLERITKIMGSMGQRLWNLAHGDDASGVTLEREVKSVSNETTLDRDTADKRELSAILLGLSQKVCRRLRQKGLAGQVVTLKLKHADFRLVTRRSSLPRPSDRTGEVFTKARELLLAYKQSGPFRLIGVGLSGLAPASSAPPELFDQDQRRRQDSLARAEDELVRRFGHKALTRAGTLDRKGEKE